MHGIDYIRTHRERKEQYIRTLEADISRLREGYSNDVTAANASLQRQRELLQAQEEENKILKEILAANGIPYEAELARRKSTKQTGDSGIESASGTRSTGPQSSAPFLTTGTSVSTNTSPGASGVDLPNPEQAAGAYPQSGFHATQIEQPGISEFSGQMNQDAGAMAVEMPGIFEKDPQLGIDFILTYVPPTLSIKCNVQ